MIFKINSLRYLVLLIMLIFAFKLFSITQIGNSWEVPQKVFTKGNSIRYILLLMMCFELIVFVINYKAFVGMFILSKLVYISCIIFILSIIIFCFNQRILGLKETNLFMSSIIYYSFYWGIAISISIVSYLTFRK